MLLQKRPVLAVAVFCALVVLVPPFLCEAQVQRTFMVEMPDGAKLHTLAILPGTGNGTWPVLLMRSPYTFESSQNFASIGVVLVMQNTRGRYQSTGQDTIFGDDAADGLVTVEWLQKQPWCNGRIATYGGSALALTQYLLAGVAGSKIAAQIAQVGAADLFHNVFFTGGVFRYELVYNWLENQAKTNKVTPPHPMLAQFEKQPLSGTPFWQKREISDWSKVAVPAVHIGGWYDIFHQGTIDAFQNYSTLGAPSARDKQILIMGPWVHSIGKSQAGELTYPTNSESFANITGAQLLVGIIDRYLKEQPTKALDSLKPVNVYVMGAAGEPGALGNQWVHAQSWPPPGVRLKVYLRANKALSPDPPQAGEGKESFRYDPKDPVKTIGGNNLTIAAGSYDQRSIESRQDVLLFSSDVLPEPLPVVGRIKAKLWVATDAKDTDFTLKLTDVYPDGRSMLVLDSIVRLRHRNTTAKEEFATPNQPLQVTIDLGSTALIFNKGHRIRVAISSSNSPRFAPNPNTGEPFAIAPSRFVIAQNTVYHEPQRSSYIELPIADLNQWLNPTPKEPSPEPIPDAGSKEPPQEPASEPLVPDGKSEPTVAPEPQITEPTLDASAKESVSELPPHNNGCSCQQGAGSGVLMWCLLGLFVLMGRRRANEGLSRKC